MATATAQPESQSIRLEAPFGDLAVAKGFATHTQVRQCLDVQAELTREGVQKKLGDLMVEHGYLLPHQLEAVIREQQCAPVQKQIKNYNLIAKLGEGGMGMVLKARRNEDGEMVALKVLFKRLAADEQYIKRFRREAQIGLTLDHPNLVHCLEVGESDGLHFMALEYVDGEDLGAALQRRSFFPEAQALAIILAAAKGMEYAHRKGLVHRDVKPANIMFTRDGRVKVMDFGLARKTSDEDHKLTMSGVVLGTPHYISPEQVEGKVEPDGRSDIYSLGLTLYHMLAGRPPFIGGNLYEIFNSHVTQQVPDPRVFNRMISPEASQLVLWMCEKDREKRVQSMERVAAEIGRALGLPSAGSKADFASPLSQLLEAPSKDPKRLQSTQAAYADILEQLRCPRCAVTYDGDPMLLSKGQRLRCPACGLNYPCPVAPPPPPPILPDQIEIQSVEEVLPAPSIASVSMAVAAQQAAMPEVQQKEAFEHEDILLVGEEAQEELPPETPIWRKLGEKAVWLAGAAAILAGAAWLGWAILKGPLSGMFK
ncbi:MAG: protein kinase [Planctomycetes bacterium]|nr:protein kinase [Planctomycetota bacterium]